MSWIDIWSFGTYSLRLLEEDLWKLTLAQFDALATRYGDEQRRFDYRAAMVCYIIAEVNRNRKKRARPFTPDDFMPKIKREEVVDSPKMKRAMKRISQMLGGGDK